jgi:hypothetical protein
MDLLSAILFIILFIGVFGFTSDANKIFAALASLGTLSFIMSFFANDYFLKLLMILLGIGLIITSILMMRGLI